MANFLSNFFNSLHLNDNDDEDEEYDDYVEQTTKEIKRAERRAERDSRKLYSASAEEKLSDNTEGASGNTSSFSEARKERFERRAERNASKVVPLRSNSDSMGIKVIKPTSFEDSQTICDELLCGRATIVNLEGFNVDLAQRVMDFISGAVYTLNGRLHQISNYIFIVSPENIAISGDYLDLIQQNGLEITNLNRDF